MDKSHKLLISTTSLHVGCRCCGLCCWGCSCSTLSACILSIDCQRFIHSPVTTTDRDAATKEKRSEAMPAHLVPCPCSLDSMCPSCVPASRGYWTVRHHPHLWCVHGIPVRMDNLALAIDSVEDVLLRGVFCWCSLDQQKVNDVRSYCRNSPNISRCCRCCSYWRWLQLNRSWDCSPHMRSYCTVRLFPCCCYR